MAEYYSLEEAAGKLGLPVDEVREMAKSQREVRAFRDGANWKFRKQDIDDLARKRTLISDPDLGSGDSIHGDDSAIFASDDMPVVIDEGALSGMGLGSSGKLGGSSASKSKKPGDSGVSISSAKGSSGGGSDPKLAFNEDDDVLFADEPISKSPSDSDVRLSLDEATGFSGVLSGSRPKNGSGPATPASRNVDLGATAALGTGGGPRTPTTGRKKPDLDATAAINTGDDLDFNFADSDVGINVDSKADSSEFELAKLDSDPVLGKGGSKSGKKKDQAFDFDEIKLADSDEIKLADSGEIKLGPPSGINLKKPNDSGIRLDDNEASSSSEFELSVDSTDSLPSFKDSDDDIPVAPRQGLKSSGGAAKSQNDDLASDFELALDDEDSSAEVEMESGSEVVALDEESEEEYDEAAADYEGYDDDAVPAGAMAGAGAGAMMAAEPAPWPGLLVLPLLLTTVALCMGGAVVLEVMRNSYTYQDGLPVTGSLASADWLKSFAGLLGGK